MALHVELGLFGRRGRRTNTKAISEVQLRVLAALVVRERRVVVMIIISDLGELEGLAPLQKQGMEEEKEGGSGEEK